MINGKALAPTPFPILPALHLPYPRATANNPWLQELPDPITKVCWDNYVSVSPEFALENNLKQGDVVKLSYGRYAVDLPIFIQPGQAYGTFAVALGYGRWSAG